ncbi:MurR/RpiR family transcriptional regulator [uncultured Clostridium sp.]|uniref:MurR/RpiR family transcriptional regulator n=1 Tax=uncultured Clostridium sp. TaxID=59620 RepID=UPI0025DD27FC|nr:MurR/RpiR family transcriptional regulator [uncultured Clostridium sp.]MDU4884972.1 MurR/RpiR family transcriptional regulator [Clostridium celatum]MDU7078157.1 MurR/RpiR family transcriptional regulator [Clostridium celatum]
MLIIENLRIKDDMSNSEKCIADFILEIGIKIDKYSTRNLAESTYTSPATVIRFCKKLGFSGFDEFKESFIKEINYLNQQSGKIDVNFPFSKDDTLMKAANNISHLYMDTIQDTMSLVDYDSLQKAITIIKYSDCISIFSAGTLLNQAESFKEKMMKIGKRVSISNNLNYQLYEVECLTSRDIAIIISYSGETEKIIEIARECKKRSIQIITITSFGENTLSQYASCKLVLSTKESLFQNLGDFSTHISLNLILDILYSSYFLLNYDENYNKKLEKTKKLEYKRYSKNTLLMNRDVE